MSTLLRRLRPSGLWPTSLVGRVFALYTLALVDFVGAGVALFIHYEFTIGLDNAQRRAEGLVLVMAPTILDSVVIGDYDTVQKTLQRAIRHSDFASAEFIDTRGGRLHVAEHGGAPGAAPRWLTDLVATRLYDANQTITAGGRDYGVLRMSYAPDAIAGPLWQQATLAVGLGLLALVGGLVGIHVPLRRWLGKLDRLQAFDREGALAAAEPMPRAEDAPLELRRTFETLERAARSRENALAALRRVLEGLLPQASGPRPGDDDIEAISHLIGVLTTRLQERGDQLDAIFALSPDGFVSFDAAHRINHVSPSFTRLTGLGEAQLLRLGEEQLIPLLRAGCGVSAERLASFAALRAQAGEGDGRLLLDIERPKRRVLAIALRTGGSAAVSQLLHVRDVTHETEVDQMKSEFLSTAAHELRTPMASIFGFVELLMYRRLSPESQRDAIATVHRQTSLMIAIINELLDLARIEARRGQDFEIVRTDLAALVHECVHDFRAPEGRDAPALALPAAPVMVALDRGKALQALRNVLSNAYKYSPEGGAVAVTLAVEHGQAVVAVRDHGIGMTPEAVRRVCERFFRADTSGSIPGTGLGMAIVKEIVDLLGGRLAIESAPQQGTTVRIVLPLAAEPAPLAEAVEPAPL